MKAVNAATLEADALATYGWMQTQGGCDGGRVGAIGFCLGGRATFVANSVIPLRAGASFYGGGIAPDEVFKVQPMDRLQSQLYRNGLFSFTRSYFATHSSKVAAGWMPDDQVLNELHEYLLKNNYKFKEVEWGMNQDWIKRYLTKEMYVWAFNKDESDRAFAQLDPEVEQAVEALPKAATLAENARKIVGQRMAPHPPGR